MKSRLEKIVDYRMSGTNVTSPEAYGYQKLRPDEARLVYLTLPHFFKDTSLLFTR